MQSSHFFLSRSTILTDPFKVQTTRSQAECSARTMSACRALYLRARGSSSGRTNSGREIIIYMTVWLPASWSEHRRLVQQPALRASSPVQLALRTQTYMHIPQANGSALVHPRSISFIVRLTIPPYHPITVPFNDTGSA